MICNEGDKVSFPSFLRQSVELSILNPQFLIFYNVPQ